MPGPHGESGPVRVLMRDGRRVDPDEVIDATAWVHLKGDRLEAERAMLASAGRPGLLAAAERFEVRADGRRLAVTAYRFEAGR